MLLFMFQQSVTASRIYIPSNFQIYLRFNINIQSPKRGVSKYCGNTPNTLMLKHIIQSQTDFAPQYIVQTIRRIITTSSQKIFALHFHSEKFRFRSSHLTKIHLTGLIYTLVIAPNKKLRTSPVFHDFEKTFDKTSHQGFLLNFQSLLSIFLLHLSSLLNSSWLKDILKKKQTTPTLLSIRSRPGFNKAEAYRV